MTGIAVKIVMTGIAVKIQSWLIVPSFIWLSVYQKAMCHPTKYFSTHFTSEWYYWEHSQVQNCRMGDRIVNFSSLDRWRETRYVTSSHSVQRTSSWGTLTWGDLQLLSVTPNTLNENKYGGLWSMQNGHRTRSGPLLIYEMRAMMARLSCPERV